jgi:hypothetical protein
MLLEGTCSRCNATGGSVLEFCQDLLSLDFQGWWHYAVALEPSITAQRNFYHAATNAHGMVGMVMRAIADAKGISVDAAKTLFGRRMQPSG